MIGLIGLLPGEIMFEVARFALMICLLVAGVCIGGKLRKNSDAKKAAKLAAETSGNQTEDAE